ncbi:MAG TPA: DUF445 family protein [Candidatus Ozemobacteraceae bacterium]|nr:DUF445 family protein [Candidatus Ozemobacteraceae bacterium]
MKTVGLVLFAVMHGYFAAWLAVWMLFYPREPRYLFGRRIPFTPGLIPASRASLERAIADAVSMQLLRPEMLEEAAIRQGIPKLIRTALPEHLDDLSNDAEFQEMLSQGVAQAVKEYLRSRSGLKSELNETSLVPFGRAAGITLDGILSALWTHLEATVDKLCRSNRFRQAMKESVLRLAHEMKTDGTPVAMKVETMAGRMLGAAMNSLDVRSIVAERLGSLTNEEIEQLVHLTAGRHLQSIKNVAAMIGVLFGALSALLF